MQKNAQCKGNKETAHPGSEWIYRMLCTAPRRRRCFAHCRHGFILLDFALTKYLLLFKISNRLTNERPPFDVKPEMMRIYPTGVATSYPFVAISRRPGCWGASGSRSDQGAFAFEPLGIKCTQSTLDPHRPGLPNCN